MRAIRGRLAGITAAIAVLASSGAGATYRVHGLPIPDGYRVSYRALARGVEMFTLVRPQERVVRVVRMRHDAPYRLRAVLSNGRLFGPAPRTERTSQMCARVKCVAAINADFFSRTGVPSGGMIANGEPIRSTDRGRPHFVLNRNGNMGIRNALPFGGTLTVTYPYPLLGRALGFESQKTFTIAGLNEPRGRNEIMAYTPRLGARTGTKGGGVEMVLKLRAGRALSNVSQAAEISGLRRTSNSTIPAGSMILSATGEAANELEGLWADVRSEAAELTGVLHMNTAAVESVAGKPVLLRGGEGVYPDVSGRNPRSIIGWTSARDVLLVTVDGRRPGYSSGMSIREAAGFMKAIGAVDALNLDGGGSTTMVVRGAVVNRPSDRIVSLGGRARKVRYPTSGHVVRDWVERSVASAITIVAD